MCHVRSSTLSPICWLLIETTVNWKSHSASVCLGAGNHDGALEGASPPTSVALVRLPTLHAGWICCWFFSGFCGFCLSTKINLTWKLWARSHPVDVPLLNYYGFLFHFDFFDDLFQDNRTLCGFRLVGWQVCPSVFHFHILPYHVWRDAKRW